MKTKDKILLCVLLILLFIILVLDVCVFYVAARKREERERVAVEIEMVQPEELIVGDDESWQDETQMEEESEEEPEVVEENKYEWLADKKICVLGDSLTYGSELPEETREQDNLTGQLQKLTGCKEVYNLGIPASTISKCLKETPMVDRYEEIPEDSDIIIVYAGTNDMMRTVKEQYGSLDELKTRTFCGDLNALLAGIKEKYTDSMLLFIIPAKTGYVTANYKMDKENKYEQYVYVDDMITILERNEWDYVDLYNMNVLDSHNREHVEKYFVVDELHLNSEGYTFLANIIGEKLCELAGE